MPLRSLTLAVLAFGLALPIAAEAAEALIDYLRTPAARAAIKVSGMNPG
jgi:hypothetical protein